MPKLPTDLEIFDAIYRQYYDVFASFSQEKANRQAKNYIPLDIQAIADHLKTEGDIIFGRLYYLHRKKYSYIENDNGRKISVPFFTKTMLKERHVIHFPLMAAILADLRKEEGRVRVATRFSLAAIAVSIVKRDHFCYHMVFLNILTMA
jgi:hypothetical protein